MADFKLTFKGKTSMSARIKAQEYINTLFQRRAIRAVRELTEAIRRVVIDNLYKTAFMRNMLNPPIGVPGYDLPAEFGILPGESQSFCRLIALILADTVDVSIKIPYKSKGMGVPTVGAFTLKVDYLNPQRYFSQLVSDPFRYTSTVIKYNKKRRAYTSGRLAGDDYDKDSSNNIEWMKWVLGGESTMRRLHPGLKSYGIAYGASPFSRSGRAVMVKQRGFGFPRRGGEKGSKVHAGFGGYRFPEGAKAKPGAKNFIEELRMDRQGSFFRAIDRRVRTAINRALPNKYS